MGSIRIHLRLIPEQDDDDRNQASASIRDKVDELSSCLDDYNAQLGNTRESDRSSSPPTPLRSILSRHGPYLAGGIACQAVSMALSMYIPIILQAIIFKLQGIPPSAAKNLSGGLVATLVPFQDSGVGLCFLIFGVSVLKAVFDPIYLQFFRGYQLRVQSVLMDAIFQKSFRLSNESRKKFDEGRIIYMMNVDTQDVGYAPFPVANVIILPIQILLSLFLLYKLIGNSILPAATTVGGFFITMIPIGRAYTKNARTFMKAGDGRVRILREILNGIRAVKMRNLEAWMLDAVEMVRKRQLRAMLSNIIITVSALPPAVIPFICLMIYTSTNNASSGSSQATGDNGFGSGVDPSVIFPSLAYFAILFEPLEILPASVQQASIASVSLKRISRFLAAGESKITKIASKLVDDDSAIEIKNATLSWSSSASKSDKASDKNGKEEETKVLFEGLNLNIKHGELTAIVGAVACLGDMTCTEGEVNVNGQIAYCHQQPWLLSQTVEENILFGNEKDVKRLNETIHACSLESDVSHQFARGLETMIGDRGTTLSGGQKARVALARAVYDPTASIYMFDDPFAALDALVGKDVFENCVLGLLKNKTRILITHDIQLLSKVDRIIILDGGKVIADGTYDEISEKDPGLLAKRLEVLDAESITVSDQRNSTKETSPLEPNQWDSIDLIAAEDRRTGSVGFRVVKEYYKMSKSPALVFLGCFILITNTLAVAGKNLWFTWWSDGTFGLKGSDYFKGYAILGGTHIATSLSFSFISAALSYFASKNLHKASVAGILRAPTSFFDSQPIGRLLNRLSRDMESIDRELWIAFSNFYVSLSMLIASIISLFYANHYIVILVVFLGIVFAFFLKLYRSSNREIRRILALEKSPLYAHISESLAGMSSLKAFKAEDRAIKRLHTLIDRSNVPLYAQMTVRIWLAVRVQFFTSFVILFVSLFGVLSTSFSPSAMGLAISAASATSGEIFLFVVLSATLEADLVSVERLLEYCFNLPQESEPRCHDDPKNDEWPSSGAIEIKNLEIKYDAMTKPAIQNLTMSIKAGEKIGIVGRTGSGKSTVVSALVRLIEAKSGTIEIDGKDISKIGLNTLRSGMEVIPQEPTLFAGTLRSNLDPYHKFTDASLWDALAMVGIKEYFSEQEKKLESRIEECGANLSAGQRQLIILARAICSKPRILVMDEASSSVDALSDKMILDVVNSQFSGRTIISVAHRLNTIAHFDRVVVMDKGVAIEFDTPANLLKIPNGEFRQLVDATGVANALLIQEIVDGRS
ncbi:Multidrug resistance-associated protein 1 [Phlyctochytrium planicorne]|nr:Multidrug resistance-associated protein 1 [Phlyctochytrium planicorne]